MEAWGRGVLTGVALLAMGQVRGEEVFTLRVPYAANLDMDGARLTGLLAAPEVQVVLNYEPLLAVPGWTGRFGYCAQHRFHICIKKNWRQVVVEGDGVHRTADSLSVDLPRHRWFGIMPYRVNRTVRVTLPPVWPEDQPGNIDIYDISLGRGQQPVVDMHLPAPYVGVGVYRLTRGADDTPGPYVISPCDAALELGADGQPRVHPEYEAAANEEWLRRLADSDWWAAQIPGVRYEHLGGAIPAGANISRVSLERAGRRYVHLRARLPGLPDGKCPGTTQYDFSWIDEQPLAASLNASPDLDSPEQCPQTNITEDALWWQGRLVSYTGPRVTNGEVSQWTAWKVSQPTCLGVMDPDMPDVGGLQRTAMQWQQIGQQAQVLPAPTQSLTAKP